MRVIIYFTSILLVPERTILMDFLSCALGSWSVEEMFVFQAVLHSPSVRQRELHLIEQLTKQTMNRFYSPRKQQRRQLEQQQHRSNSRSRSRHRCASNQTLHNNTRRRTSKRSSSDTSVMSMMSVTQLP